MDIGRTNMYGTVARVKALPGKEQDLKALSEEWTKARGASTGQVVEYVFKMDNNPNEYMVVGIFTDREAYRKNAEDPETDRWYRRMREMLQEDPEWNDGEVISATTV
jgi:quinol monooxygenase YgiN